MSFQVVISGNLMNFRMVILGNIMYFQLLLAHIITRHPHLKLIKKKSHIKFSALK